MPTGTQTPIPNPYWHVCRYLVPNTFLILWFFSKLVAFTPAIFPPLTASSLLFILWDSAQGSSSLASPFPSPSPQVQGLLPPPSYHPMLLLSIHQPRLSVYWGMIFKICRKSGAAQAIPHQNTSWLLLHQCRVTTCQPAERWCSPTRHLTP